MYAKWLNQNVYHRSSLNRNGAENKDLGEEEGK